MSHNYENEESLVGRQFKRLKADSYGYYIVTEHNMQAGWCRCEFMEGQDDLYHDTLITSTKIDDAYVGAECDQHDAINRMIERSKLTMDCKDLQKNSVWVEVPQRGMQLLIETSENGVLVTQYNLDEANPAAMTTGTFFEELSS